jgi:tRNA G18 (ribose-2'-O)-methylase SpoU
MTEDTRNVTDFYKGMTTDLIKGDLDKKRSQLINLCCNINGDFNKASIIRANNAFLGSKVIIAGRKRYDKRGTVGTHHYEHVEHWDDPIEAIQHYIEQNYDVIPVDNTVEYDPTPLYYSGIRNSVETFNEKTMFVYGEEQAGLSKEIIEACNNHPVYIPQRGSVRSLNVAQAAACCMMLYDMKYGG